MRLLLAVLLLGFVPQAMAQSRVKDIAQISGLRANQLIGYGLVIGLPGTGDTLRNAPYTDQALKSMLDHLGVNVRNADPKIANVAAVIVTTELPALAKVGSRIDVSVSSLGDATSLRGGTLVMTALIGADSKVYAAAQGPLIVSGFAAAGAAQSVEEGIATVGRVPSGAIIERAIEGDLAQLANFGLELANPDFQTSVDIAAAINVFAAQKWGVSVASPIDHRTVQLKRPGRVQPAQFLAEIGLVEVGVDNPARVVVDERTGTVVIGENVRLSKVAITHGNLNIRITEVPTVVQPNPFSDGTTETQPMTDISVGEAGDDVAIVAGNDLENLVSGLNKLGVKPKGIIAVLQAIKTAGALQAELVVQ